MPRKNKPGPPNSGPGTPFTALTTSPHALNVRIHSKGQSYGPLQRDC
jgi:hypothetical protein